MTVDLTLAIIAAVASLLGLAIAAVAALKAFNAWLDYKRAELAATQPQDARSPAANRIELADLKERLRKLEAIANGVNL